MRVQIAPGISAEVPESELPKFLAERKAQLEANPLIGYVPNSPRHVAYHSAQTRIAGLIGGNRSGKSVAGVVDDLIQALPEEWVPDHLKQYKRWHPPFFCRVVTPDLGHTLQEVLDAIREWCPPGAMKGGSFDSAYRKDKRIFELECGSRFDFMSFETDLDKFGGVSRHRIRYDEEPPGEKGRQIRKAGLQRIRDTQGDERWTLTPEFGLSWLYTDIWENRGPEVEERVWANDEMVLVRATTYDNPHVPRDETADKAMTDEEYKVKVLGEFFHLKGLVYGAFRESANDKGPGHVVDVPSAQHVQGLPEILVGIDPGVRTTGVVFCGFDRDNHMLIFDELYLHYEDEEDIPERVAKEIKLKEAEWKIKPKWYIIDPSSRNRTGITGQDVQAAYHRAGIPVYPGNNSVQAGIFEMRRRMASDLISVSCACEKWLWERRRYRMNDTSDKFEVVKQDDHLLDPTRYVAMAHPLPSAQPSQDALPPARWVPGTAPPADFRPRTPNTAPPMGRFS